MSQTSHAEGFEDFLRTRFSQIAVEAGFGEGRYAESFQRVPTA